MSFTDGECRGCFYEQWSDAATAKLTARFERALLSDKALRAAGLAEWEPMGYDFDNGRVGFLFQCDLDGSWSFGAAKSTLSAHLARLRKELSLPSDAQLSCDEDVYVVCSCDQGKRVVRIVLRLRSQNTEEMRKHRINAVLESLGVTRPAAKIKAV